MDQWKYMSVYYQQGMSDGHRTTINQSIYQTFTLPKCRLVWVPNSNSNSIFIVQQEKTKVLSTNLFNN